MRTIGAMAIAMVFLAVSCQTSHGGEDMTPLMEAKASAEGFTLEDNGNFLALFENGKPVLAYRYTMVQPPEGVPEKFARMSYIHPLYGLDGDVLTQDFPDDHYHHRGVFWTWPKCTAGDRPMDVWLVDGVRQVFDKWITREATKDAATVAVENVWVFDDDPEPKVREHIEFVVHPADELGRAIDFYLKFTNVCDDVVTIRGATTANKGYGGLCYRPDKARKPMHFTTAKGPIEKDQTKYETPWADCTSRVEPDGPTSGVAIFQHPANPGYPHPGWLFRHYGFLGVSYPHNDTLTLNPGDSFDLQYRMYVHCGDAEFARVAECFDAYVEKAKEMAN
ncbi:MAG: DUF6807 family protein [Candidatus Hydrogenedentota bacterium]